MLAEVAAPEGGPKFTRVRLSHTGRLIALGSERGGGRVFAPAIFAFKRARKELLRIIAADQVPDRPNRNEPRLRKRRPKQYPFLGAPRRKARIDTLRELRNEK